MSNIYIYIFISTYVLYGSMLFTPSSSRPLRYFHTQTEEYRNNSNRFLSSSPHQYRPKHSWIQWTHIANSNQQIL